MYARIYIANGFAKDLTVEDINMRYFAFNEKQFFVSYIFLNFCGLILPNLIFNFFLNLGILFFKF